VSGSHRPEFVVSTGSGIGRGLRAHLFGHRLRRGQGVLAGLPRSRRARPVPSRVSMPLRHHFDPCSMKNVHRAAALRCCWHLWAGQPGVVPRTRRAARCADSPRTCNSSRLYARLEWPDTLAETPQAALDYPSAGRWGTHHTRSP